MKTAFNRKTESEKADAIIVGAGIAGLSIAFELLEKARRTHTRKPRILILEADTELGGRARSIELDGHVVNTGGQWLHDSTGNPFYHWLKTRYTDLTFSQDRVSRDLIITKNGVENPSFYERMSALFYQTYQQARQKSPDHDPSLAELAKETEDPDALAFARYMAREWMAIEDPALISGNEMFGEGYNPGGPQVRQGMSAVIQKMVADLTSQGVVIRTATPVSAVEQDEQSARVKTSDGRIYEAAAGAVTVSAGVLQANRITFHPALSEKLTNYIGNLTMGKMTKIIVPFRKDFFTQRHIGPNTFVSIIDDDMTAFCHLRSMGAPVVTIYPGGAISETMERAPRQDVESFLRKTFNRLGDYMKGYEAAMAGPPYVSSWNTSPLTAGAYSSIKPGAQRSDPIRQGRLVFAGEAFIIRDEYGKEPSGTMSAAWSSGRLAANQIFPLIVPALRAPLRPKPDRHKKLG